MTNVFRIRLVLNQVVEITAGHVAASAPVTHQERIRARRLETVSPNAGSESVIDAGHLSSQAGNTCQGGLRHPQADGQREWDTF